MKIHRKINLLNVIYNKIVKIESLGPLPYKNTIKYRFETQIIY